tara:strand:+ start:1266 stop:2378 length:1113 start_codon:yes stop_codon:yes gene_type:complete
MKVNLKFLVIVIIVIVLAGCSASTQREMLAAAFEDKVKYQIVVIDENNEPVPGATVWVLSKNITRMNLQPTVVMERIINRNAIDSDYIFNRHSPHPALFVYYTNQNGEIDLEFGVGDVRDLKVLSSAFAVLKRGYKTKSHHEEVKINSKNKLELKLERDNSIQFDKRLLVLDEVRASISETKKSGAMSDERLLKLENGEKKLGDLAWAFEVEGQNDLASMIYYNLMYLPTVTKTKNEKGNVVIRGYTNSFDKKSINKQQYRDNAIRLNKSVPIVLYRRYYDQFDSSAGRRWRVDDSKSDLRKEFIKTTEKYYTDYPNRMWAWPYVFLWQAYKAEGEYQKAMKAITAFRTLEPSYYNEERWEDLARTASSK